MKDRSLNKGSLYYLMSSPDNIYEMFTTLGLSIGLLFLIQKFIMPIKTESFKLYILYLFILGINFLLINVLIVNLTIKDKLSQRLEFFIASGFDVKDIIKIYSLQIFRLSNIIPFILFFIIYNINDWETSNFEIFSMYFSTLLLCFTGVLFLNTLTLSIKRFKLFKNIMFFTNFLFIYLASNLSTPIIDTIETYNISFSTTITIINIIVSIIMGGVIMKKFKHMNNEDIIQRNSLWE